MVPSLELPCKESHLLTGEETEAWQRAGTCEKAAADLLSVNTV